MNLAWRQQKLMVFIIRGENKSHLSWRKDKVQKLGGNKKTFLFPRGQKDSLKPAWRGQLASTITEGYGRGARDVPMAMKG